VPNNLIFAQPCPSKREISAEQVDQWREEGYTFVSDLLPPDLVSELAEIAKASVPEPGSIEAGNIADFGSGGRLTFPSEKSAFNDITLNETLIKAIARLLGVNAEEIRLSQSDLWPKYGRPKRSGIQDNSDQRIHVDYPNHTLTHPTPWNRPEAVELILYLSDYEDTAGSTAVVPRTGSDDPAYRWPIVDSPGIGELRYINDKESAENYFKNERPELSTWRELLYSREKLAAFKPGNILFYRHDTWHRGTPMTDGKLRLVQNITYRKAQSEWISTLHEGWAWKAYRDSKYLEKLIARSSLIQRAVMGFPQPGSDYWCPETIEAVKARYGMFGFDDSPYLAELNTEL
jgi:hypothetical protein